MAYVNRLNKIQIRLFIKIINVWPKPKDKYEPIFSLGLNYNIIKLSI